MNKRSKQYLSLVWLLIGGLAALADHVILKNGHVFDGIIESETPSRINLQIDSGTIQLSRESIRRIERAQSGQNQIQAEEWEVKHQREKELLSGPHAELIDRFNKLLRQKKAVQVAGKRLMRFDQKQLDYSKARPVVMGELEQFSMQIARLTRQIKKDPLPENEPKTHAEVRAYNQRIHRVALLQTQRASLYSETQARQVWLEKERLEIEQQTQQRKLDHQTILFYVQELQSFSSRFDVFKKAFRPEQESPEAMALYKKIDKTLARYRAATPTHHIPAEQRGNSTIVYALINGKALGEFVFDTGATSMVLYEPLARKLGVQTANLPFTKVVVADGSIVQGRRATLKTVRVGDAEVRNVSAIILPDSLNHSCDGLLGMSFLRHFMINLDGRNGEIELVRISP